MGSKDLYVSAEMDATCHRLLFQQLSGMLQGMAGGRPEDDKKLLAKGGLTRNMQNAVHARLGEKQLLIAFLEQLGKAKLSRDGIFSSTVALPTEDDEAYPTVDDSEDEAYPNVE